MSHVRKFYSARRTARAAAGIVEFLTGHRKEFPVVAPRLQRQFQDTVRGVAAYLAVRCHPLELVDAAAAGADDELADPALRIHFPFVILRRKSLVIVIVAAEDDIGAGLVQQVP